MGEGITPRLTWTVLYQIRIVAAPGPLQPGGEIISRAGEFGQRELEQGWIGSALFDRTRSESGEQSPHSKELRVWKVVAGDVVS